MEFKVCTNSSPINPTSSLARSLISVTVYLAHTHNPVLFLLAQDDGTDTEFRNVGLYTSDGGEIPKRILTTFRTRRKLENYQFLDRLATTL